MVSYQVVYSLLAEAVPIVVMMVGKDGGRSDSRDGFKAGREFGVRYLLQLPSGYWRAAACGARG